MFLVGEKKILLEVVEHVAMEKKGLLQEVMVLVGKKRISARGFAAKSVVRYSFCVEEKCIINKTC